VLVPRQRQGTIPRKRIPQLPFESDSYLCFHPESFPEQYLRQFLDADRPSKVVILRVKRPLF